MKSKLCTLIKLTLIKYDFRIKITFNVNHSVDSDVEPDIDPNMDKPDVGELKSKPSFRVELLRGNTTISLMCSFVNPGEESEYSMLI